MRYLATFLVPALLLGGCTIRTPDDLTLTFVEDVAYEELPFGYDFDELMRTEAAMRRRYSGQEVEADDIGDFDAGITRRLRGLRVGIASKMHLQQWRADQPGIDWFDVRFCAWPFINGPHASWGNDPDTRHTNTGDGQRTDTPADGLYHYTLYFSAQGEDLSGIRHPSRSYDLRDEAEDICFYVAGSLDFPLRYQSNTVRIPKEAIAAALRGTPAGAGE